MKGRHVILGQLYGRRAAALMVDGQLEDVLPDTAPLAAFPPGAILRGQAERLMKGQGGVFVRLPDGARGYLRDRAGLAPGKPVLVQISGIAEPGKAIPLTTRLLIKGRHGIVTPGAAGVNVSRRVRDGATREALTAQGQALLGARPHGLILRSAAEAAAPDDIAAELTELLALTDAILADAEGPPALLLDAPDPWAQGWLDWSDPAPDQIDEGDATFEALGVTEAIDSLLHPEIALPAGASAVIEPTRALVAIDVNTGNDGSNAAGLKANIALARDLPRQLRLRGLGGQIIVDFAPMPKRDRAALDQVLRAAFRRDATEATLVGWTAMGLYEINRKRDRVPLTRLAAQAEGIR